MRDMAPEHCQCIPECAVGINQSSLVPGTHLKAARPPFIRDLRQAVSNSLRLLGVQHASLGQRLGVCMAALQSIMYIRAININLPVPSWYHC